MEAQRSPTKDTPTNRRPVSRPFRVMLTHCTGNDMEIHHLQGINIPQACQERNTPASGRITFALLCIASTLLSSCGQPTQPPALQRLLPSVEEQDLADVVHSAESDWVTQTGRPRVTWEFDRTESGWSPVHDIYDATQEAGVLRGTVRGTDPAIATSDHLQTSPLDYLWLRLATDESGPGQVFWATTAAKFISEERSLRFPIRGGGEMVDYVLPIGTNPGWRDEVIRLRLDPPPRSGRIELDFVRIVEADETSSPEVQHLDGTAGKASFDGDLRLSMLSIAPSENSWEITTDHDARLRFSYGVLPASWARLQSGVRFSVFVGPTGGNVREEIFSDILRPRTREEDRGWHDADVELSQRHGSVTLRFRTDSAIFENDSAHRSKREDGSSPISDSSAYGVWGNPRVVRPSSPERPNIVIVALDTLRADTVGAYGYERDTTPHLDRFAASATSFEHAIAQAPWSLPSYASLFTSLYPSMVGVIDPTNVLPDDATTLATLLHQRGYRTIGFTEGGYAGHAWGMDRGFERFWEGTDPARTTKLLRDWLDKRPATPFFLYLHTYELHDYFQASPAHVKEAESLVGRPLELPEDVRQAVIVEGGANLEPRDFAEIRSLYDGAVRVADEWFGRWLHLIEDANLLQDSVVVVLSDHGESFGEHGGVHHGGSLYPEQIRVPLLVQVPALQNRIVSRVGAPVELVDVLPTILELAGFVPPADVQGRSLVPYLTGAASHTEPVAGRATAYSELTDLDLYSLAAPDWQYIYGNRPGACGATAPLLETGRYCELFLGRSRSDDFAVQSGPPGMLPSQARAALVDRYLMAVSGLHLITSNPTGDGRISFRFDGIDPGPPSRIYSEKDDTTEADHTELRLHSGDLDIVSWTGITEESMGVARLEIAAPSRMELLYGPSCEAWPIAETDIKGTALVAAGSARLRVPWEQPEKLWACVMYLPRLSPSPEISQPSPAALERLKALGYIR